MKSTFDNSLRALYIALVFLSISGLGLYYTVKAFEHRIPGNRNEFWQIFRSRGYIRRDYFTESGWKFRILGLILPPLAFVVSIILWFSLEH